MAGVNRIVRSISPKSLFPAADAVTSTTADYNQGDLLVYDTTAKVIRKPATEAECSEFLGIAIESVVDGKVVSPYQGTAVDAAQAIASLPGPQYGVVAKLVSKTGDAWAPGDAVYADPASGPYYVSSAGTKQIGIYQGKTIASAAAGQSVEVLLGARYSDDTLKF